MDLLPPDFLAAIEKLRPFTFPATHESDLNSYHTELPDRDDTTLHVDFLTDAFLDYATLEIVVTVTVAAEETLEPLDTPLGELEMELSTLFTDQFENQLSVILLEFPELSHQGVTVYGWAAELEMMNPETFPTAEDLTGPICRTPARQRLR